MLIYSSIQLYYNLYLLLQPIFSLFFVFLAIPTGVKPLCKSQFVTEQGTDVAVPGSCLALDLLKKSSLKQPTIPLFRASMAQLSLRYAAEEIRCAFDDI